MRSSFWRERVEGFLFLGRGPQKTMQGPRAQGAVLPVGRFGRGVVNTLSMGDVGLSECGHQGNGSSQSEDALTGAQGVTKQHRLRKSVTLTR